MKNDFCECASLDRVIEKLDYDVFCEKELCSEEPLECYFSDVDKTMEKVLVIRGAKKIRKKSIGNGIEFCFTFKKTSYKLSAGFTNPSHYFPGEKGTLSVTSGKSFYFREKIYELRKWRRGLNGIFGRPKRNPI